ELLLEVLRGLHGRVGDFEDDVAPAEAGELGGAVLVDRVDDDLAAVAADLDPDPSFARGPRLDRGFGDALPEPVDHGPELVDRDGGSQEAVGRVVQRDEADHLAVGVQAGGAFHADVDRRGGFEDRARVGRVRPLVGEPVHGADDADVEGRLVVEDDRVGGIADRVGDFAGPDGGRLAQLDGLEVAAGLDAEEGELVLLGRGHDLRRIELRPLHPDADVGGALGAGGVAGEEESLLREDDAAAGPFSERRQGADGDDRIDDLLVDALVGVVRLGMERSRAAQQDDGGQDGVPYLDGQASTIIYTDVVRTTGLRPDVRTS